MSADVEAILNEIGKAFRLCRLYPASHPSVQQALAGVSTLLPQLTRTGPAELRIMPAGFTFEGHPVAARNAQVQSLAGLLYALGHRFVVLEPGVRADEVVTLIQIAGAADKSHKQAAPAAGGSLVHLKLTRRSATARPSGPVPAVPAPATMHGEIALGRQTFTEFRPDALPPGIESRRLAVALGQGGPGALEAARRLGELVEGLVKLSDYDSIARAVRSLGRAASGADPAVAAAAAKAIADKVSRLALSGLLARLGDASLPPDERDEAAHALAALGDRALGPVADRYLVAGDADERDILAAVVRLAGPGSAAPILARANPDARGDAAVAWVRLLAATRAAQATRPLEGYARHADGLVRAAAVAALAELDDPEARRIAAAALRDAEPQVRAAAALGIGRYGEPSSAPLVMARLGDEADEHALIAMIDALGALCDPRAVPQLIELSKAVIGPFQRRAPPIRIAAVLALGHIRTPEALAIIEERLTSGTAAVRAAASQALGR